MAKAIRKQQGDVFDQEAIKSATAIEPIALNEEFVRLPSDLAYWNSVYADALGDLLRAERTLEEGEARAREEHRAAVPEDEKVTEKALDARVALDPRYMKLREAVDDAAVAKARASGVVDAIRAKREMVVSLGAQLRAEMQPAPSINTMERRMDELERRAERYWK